MARRKKSAAADAAKKFLKVFGPGEQYRPYDEGDAERLSERLPEVVRLILEAEGWCSYQDQVLWLCDPEDWKTAARAWLPDAPGAQVYARTAFGDLFVWDGELFRYVMARESRIMTSVPSADFFFSTVLTDEDFAPRSYLPEMVAEAREKAGPLKWDEMYTYVPALALGGSPESSRVERVKALPALSMLSQLAPVRRS